MSSCACPTCTLNCLRQVSHLPLARGGLATRYVALVMVVFMLVATFSSHRYWQFTGINVRRIQNSNFFKNVAMIRGFCFLFVCSSDRFSIDAWLRKHG